MVQTTVERMRPSADPDEDLDEARELIRRAAIERVRTRPLKAKNDAARALLARVASLNGTGGFAFVLGGPHELHAMKTGTVGGAESNVRVLFFTGEPEPGFLVEHAGERAVIPLDFDPIAERYIGATDDEFRTPAPGEPRRRRSAVAVIVEAILRELSRPT